MLPSILMDIQFDWLYGYDVPANGLCEAQVVADITGATKPRSFGIRPLSLLLHLATLDGLTTEPQQPSKVLPEGIADRAQVELLGSPINKEICMLGMLSGSAATVVGHIACNPFVVSTSLHQ